MNSTKTSISKVKALLKQGKINDAHLILSKLLINDPQNKYVKKTIKNIESNENFLKTNFNSDLNNMINKIVDFYQSNQIENAIVEVEKAYSEYPNSSMINNLKGLISKKQNRFLEAEKFFKKAYEIDPNLYEAVNNLGNLYYQVGLFDEAKESYTNLIINHPNYIHGYSNRSNVFLQQNMLQDALDDINLAIDKNPKEATFWYNKSNILKTMNKNSESLTCLNKAIEINPNYTQALNNKSSLLEEMGNLDDAIKFADICLSIEKNNSTYHYNKGAILSRLGNLEGAQISLKNALSINPDHHEARWNLSNCQLLSGNLSEGIINFEARRKLSFWIDRKFHKPELSNLDQVFGKKILVTSEQGLGDTIHFARFARKLSSLGAIVYLEVQKPLKALIKNGTNFSIITKDDDEVDFDFHIPLMSTLKLFSTKDIFTEEPTEFQSHIQQNKKWDNFFKQNKFNIGIAWQGNPNHQDDKRGSKYSRSFSLKNLLFLKKFRNINVFNLQKNYGYEQIDKFGLSNFIHDFGNNFDEGENAFCDTIPVIKKLDLVITCDTSIAHIAGSLGAPVWTALKFVPDWRWLLETSDTNWYSSMQLYRQKSLGNWNDVFSEMELKLSLKLKNHFSKVA